LIKLFRGVGVVVAFVPELPKTRAQGAARWITPSKALIQLSCRGKRNDILWFSFFHEAGHLLLHGKKASFVDTDSAASTDKEREADEFASNILLPRRELKEFVAEAKFSEEAVVSFAEEVGVHPAIVVGRLQHEKIIGHDRLSHLIDRVTHEDVAAATNSKG